MEDGLGEALKVLVKIDYKGSCGSRVAGLLFFFSDLFYFALKLLLLLLKKK